MTDWSSVEFASTAPRSRKADDVLPILSDLLLVVDFASCASAGALALAFYGHVVLAQKLSLSATGPFWRDIVLGSTIAACFMRESAALQRRPGVRSLASVIIGAEQRCLGAFAVLVAVGMLTRATDDLAHLWLGCWFALFAACVAGTRGLAFLYLSGLHGSGAMQETIAIVGSGDLGDRLAARIASGARIVGNFRTPRRNDGGHDRGPDGLDDLLELGRNGGVDSVILAVSREHTMDVPHVVSRLKALPVQVSVCSEDGWDNRAAPQMRLLAGLPMAVVSDRPLKRWNLVGKIVLDRVGALLMLAALVPVIAVISAAVALSSPGPIIFRQIREGWCGRRFVVFKFRTMRHAQAAPVLQTRRGDKRCTPVGRVLRRCSLDELPQLWNVVRGDMSLVGPRPHAESLHDIDSGGCHVVAEYAQRHRVKPGITGWAQVNGARGATDTLEQLRRRVEFDLYYIEHWSLWLDLAILLRTPFSMMGENAF